MGVEIQGLEFEIEAKSTNAAKGVDALAESFKRLKSSVKGGAGLEKVSKQLDAISNAKVSLSGVQKIEDLTKALNTLSTTKVSSTIAKRISEIGASLDSISLSGVERMEDLSRALQGMQGVSVPNLKNVTNTAGASPVGTPSTGGAVDSGIEHTTSEVVAATTATSRLKAVLSTVGGVWGKAFSVGASIVGKVTSGVKKLTSAAQSAIKATRKLGSTIGSKLGAKVKQATGGLGGMFASLKRIAMYRAIRAFLSALTKAMKESIQNLYQYSSAMGGTFAGSMDRLATSFQYLKNSMGAMISPLINALAPAVDALIDKFVKLLNVVNQFFARLSGATTFTRAKKQAASYGDSISGAAGKAKKAAKEIKDATTGIDELNIIDQKDDDNGSGSGGGGKDFAGMFEEVPIDSGISEFTDKLKEAFNAGDWKGLGELLGNKLNEIVESIDWDGIGHKLGYYFNGAIQTWYYFLKTFNFRKLGNHVAELFNAALSEIDFNIAGRAWTRKFTAALDLLIGFLEKLDWKLLGKSIGDFLKGAMDEASEWLASYDWSKAAHKAYKSLKELITGLDFAGIAKSFFKLLGSALGAAVSFIGTFVADIWKDINEYFQKYLTNDDGTKKCGLDWVAGLLKGIWEGIKNIGKWIKENVFDPFIEGFKECFGIHSPSKVMQEMGCYVVEGFLKGLNKFSEIAGKVKKFASDVIEWFRKGEDGKGIVEHFKDFGSKIVSGFKEKVGSTYQTVKTNVTTWASNVKQWFTNSSFGGVNAQNFSTFANNTIEGFKNKVGSAYTNTKSNIMTWASNVKTWFTNSSFGGVNNANFQTFANNTIEGFKSKIGSAYTNTKSNITTWATNVKSWFTGAGFGGVNNATFQTYANNVITGFKDKIGAAYTNTKSNITTWATNVKTWFNSIASKSAFEGFAGDVINGFKTKISNSYTDAKSSMTTFASSVKSWFEKPDGSTLVSKFTGIGKNIIHGFIDGVNSLWDTAMRKIKDFGKSIISKGKEGTDEHSPSKAFRKIGAFVIEGFNLGISDMIPSSYKMMNQWTSGLKTHAPSMQLAVDTSALKYYDSSAFTKSISTDVRSSTEIGTGGFREAMEDFYREYVEPTMNQMAEDMRRQADKSEQTVVQVGNRVVTDAVEIQQKANGYRFTK